MNQKKAKRIRQLVRHLQDKGVVENQEWANYGQDQKFVKMSVDGKIPGNMQNVLVPTGARKLDPTCGKAVYKAMKERGERIADHRQ